MRRREFITHLGSAAGLPGAAITATRRRTRSAISAGRRSNWPSSPHAARQRRGNWRPPTKSWRCDTRRPRRRRVPPLLRREWRHLFVEALLGAPRNTPVIRNDALQGWVSAHYTGGPHHWSRANVETIETTARRVRELIDRQVGG
jgi:hypothetical protein